MRCVIVTGAGHGIGAATARRFAADGDLVIVTDVDLEAAEAVAASIRSTGGSGEAVWLDVGDSEAWAALRRALDDKQLAPAVVVNNAFRNTVAAAHDLDPAQWRSTIDVSLGGVYLSVHTFHDTLSAQRGSVVNVASVHALMAWRGHPAYAAAKGGVVALTRQLSLEYAPEVRVNAVLPGSIDTRVWDSASPEQRAAAAAAVSLGRLGTADEVAAVVAFLAGPEASYVTGAALPVDGGLTTSIDR
jgi:NAD(P)-dependent dehydrogenase (short-subunit alcohol dehydrogenase family)